MLLIGNKLDLENKRKITYHRGLNLANKNDLEFKKLEILLNYLLKIKKKGKIQEKYKTNMNLHSNLIKIEI